MKGALKIAEIGIPAMDGALFQFKAKPSIGAFRACMGKDLRA
jgi:hypothetical protein